MRTGSRMMHHHDRPQEDMLELIKSAEKDLYIFSLRVFILTFVDLLSG